MSFSAITADPSGAPLRVAIDCRVVDPIENGLTVYVLNLVEALVADCEGLRLGLVTRPDDELHPRLRETCERAAITRVPCEARFMRPRQHVEIPRALGRLGPVDVFHYPHFDLPWLLRIPTVVTVTDLNYLTIREYYAGRPLATLKRLYSRLAANVTFRRARQILAISEHTAARVQSLLGSEIARKVTVTHCALDTDLAAAAAEAPPRRGPGERPAFLYVGTDRFHKNLELILRAYDRALEGQRHPWGFRMVGQMSEPTRQRVVELARELGIDERLEMLGYVDRDRLIQEYRSAGALCLCSLNEGFGLPVLEAMAFGTPVITSDRGATREVAGEAGLLADPESLPEIAEAMSRLMRDEGRWRELSTAGIERAREFSWQRTAEATRAAYVRAADRSPTQ